MSASPYPQHIFNKTVYYTTANQFLEDTKLISKFKEYNFQEYFCFSPNRMRVRKSRVHIPPEAYIKNHY